MVAAINPTKKGHHNHEMPDIDHSHPGAGLMGHGIAQVFASAGFRVNLFDADTASLKTAKDRIANNFKPSSASILPAGGC
jgi:hypothetical protein